MADLNTYLTRLLYSRLPQLSSAGSASGVLTVSTTSAATIADTNETDLWTYSLPANTLSADGRAVRITVRLTYAANANTKTSKLKIGSDSFSLNTVTTAPNGSGHTAQVVLVRTDSTNQYTYGTFNTVGGSTQSATTSISGTADVTAAITIKVTGTNGTAAANDIVFKGAIVEILN